MNLVVLRGNVGGEPKITTFKDGGKVAQFSLATTKRGYKTADGREVEEKTVWHNIVVKRSGLAGVVEEFVKKGTPLLVVGELDTRSYEDSEGKTRYVTEVVVTDFELLGGKGEHATAPAPEPEDFKGANRYSGPQPAAAPENAVKAGSVDGQPGGDLPFDNQPGASC